MIQGAAEPAAKTNKQPTGECIMQIYMFKVAPKSKTNMLTASTEEIEAVLSETSTESEARKNELCSFFNTSEDFGEALNEIRNGNTYAGHDVDGMYAVSISAVSMDAAKLGALEQHISMMEETPQSYF
jgi:hypothetical protein